MGFKDFLILVEVIMKKYNLDEKGQLSLEYILSSMIVILIISLISVPVLLTRIDYSDDIIDSINSKEELSKITEDNVKRVYNI